MKRKASITKLENAPRISLRSFAARVPKLDEPMNLASTQDIYFVYNHMLARVETAELCACRNFHYILAGSKEPAASNKDGWKDVVIPLGCRFDKLSVDLLTRIFECLKHSQTNQMPDQIVLGMADSDGSVVLHRIFNSVQPPFERYKPQSDKGYQELTWLMDNIWHSIGVLNWRILIGKLLSHQPQGATASQDLFNVSSLMSLPVSHCHQIVGWLWFHLSQVWAAKSRVTHHCLFMSVGVMLYALVSSISEGPSCT